MLAMDACLFCSIISGQAQSRRVYEDEQAVAFLDIAPATRGHTLVVPRDHTADLWAISEAAVTAVAGATRHVARLLRERLNPDGLNVVQSNGAAAGQEIFHFHAHVVPRYLGDGLRAMWRPAIASDEDLDAVLSTLLPD
jgi:histidine triad (HIT) family protein